MIPDFNSHGYLPPGIHPATLARLRSLRLLLFKNGLGTEAHKGNEEVEFGCGVPSFNLLQLFVSFVPFCPIH